MSCDYSSSEDELEKLEEAVDKNFLPQCLYKNGISEEKSGISSKPSLRKQYNQDTVINPFSVKVTPEFQKHVSKHLSKLLDELIDDTNVISKKKRYQVEHSNSGIKLLRSSKNYLMLVDERDSHINLRNIYRKRVKEKIDFEKRAKEVAVSPDWVLSKQEIRQWAPETKGEVEIVRLDESYEKLNLKRKKLVASRHK